MDYTKNMNFNDGLSGEGPKNFGNLEGKAILGIDFGTKSIGLATFTPGRDPFPLLYDQIPGANSPKAIQAISQLASNEGIELIVLGLPLLNDGADSDLTKKVRKFKAQLEQSLETDPIPIELQDESYTSFEAEERMKNSPRFNFKIDKSKLDAMAASIILEDYIRKYLKIG